MHNEKQLHNIWGNLKHEDKNDDVAWQLEFQLPSFLHADTDNITFRVIKDRPDTYNTEKLHYYIESDIAPSWNYSIRSDAEVISGLKQKVAELLQLDYLLRPSLTESQLEAFTKTAPQEDLAESDIEDSWVRAMEVIKNG